MSNTKPPRVVLVTRRSEYETLLERHGTHAQAQFFLETRQQSIEDVQALHVEFQEALRRVQRSIPSDWRRSRLDRGDLDRFLFEPDDILVALGQDGLVANLAKYLEGQPVIGLNPCAQRNEGVLVPHPPEAAGDLLAQVAAGRASLEARTMVHAELDDGLELCSLNEVFVGHRTHQSARYRLSFGGAEERHSSSGVIVSTGTGATGWARSINRGRARCLELPGPEDERLAFFVREAWPSVASGSELTQGLLEGGEVLELVSEMDDDGVVFGDGMESDRMQFGWGRRLRIGVAARRLQLVRG